MLWASDEITLRVKHEMARPNGIIKLIVKRFLCTESHVETKPDNDDAKNCLFVFCFSFLKFISLFLKLFEHFDDFIFREIFANFYVFDF